MCSDYLCNMCKKRRFEKDISNGLEYIFSVYILCNIKYREIVLRNWEYFMKAENFI